MKKPCGLYSLYKLLTGKAVNTRAMAFIHSIILSRGTWVDLKNKENLDHSNPLHDLCTMHNRALMYNATS